MIISTKIRKYAGLSIKLFIGAFSFGFIYYQLIYKKNLLELLSAFIDDFQTPTVIAGLMTVFFLMLFNWLTEAVKWRFLISRLENASIAKSIKAIILGINTSIFMPNRIGEFVGRIFLLQPKIRIHAIILTFAGNFAQFITTAFFGTIGLIWYFSLDSIFVFPQLHYINWLIIALSLLFTAGILLLYFNISVFLPFLRRFFKKTKHLRYFIVLRKLDFVILIKVLLYSLLRYFIFCMQFWLLLQLFGVELDFIEGLLIIFLIYFVLTLVPTIALVEIGVRGAVSVFLINSYVGHLTHSQQLAIVLVALLLWLINLALPAVIGLFFIKDLRFNKQE